MENLIIRRRNRVGNSLSNLVTLLAWLFHIIVLILALVTQLGFYNDSLVVLQLIFGISNHVLVQCWQTLLICTALLILPTLAFIAAKNEVSAR